MGKCLNPRNIFEIKMFHVEHLAQFSFKTPKSEGSYLPVSKIPVNKVKIVQFSWKEDFGV